MKKKGFTLIEIIVAIAILMIGIMTVSVISSGTLSAYKANQIKIENINYADTIINILKANGKLYVKDIYGDFNVNSSDHNCTFNLYFDDLTQLEDAITNDATPESWTDSSTMPTDMKDKKNCAFIRIDDASVNIGPTTDHKVNLYNILIKVWNFEYGNSSEVKFRVYIGR